MTCTKKIIRYIFFILGVMLMLGKPSLGQETSRLTEEIKSFREAVTFTVSGNEIDFLNPMSFGFVQQGIVAISQDHSALTCYRTDGSIAWRKAPPERVISAIHVSDNGRIIAAYYPLNESKGVTEVITDNGEVLWRNVYEAGFRVSPSGKYLYSGPSALSGMPLTVIDVETGAVLWKQSASDFAAELLDEETILHLSRGELQVIRMSTGNILQRRDLGAYFKDELSHTLWELSVSDDRAYFTILGKSGKSLNNLIHTYDSSFKLKWSRTFAPPPFQLVGLSEDGSKVLVTQGVYGISFYDNLTGNLLWRVEDAILNNGAIVTNEFIAMRQVGHNSEVLVIAQDGSLSKRFKSHSIFLKTQLPKMVSTKGAISLSTTGGSIIEIKKNDAGSSIIFYARKEK